jgi:hypothetical protein
MLESSTLGQACIQILIATTMPDRRDESDEVIRQLHERQRKRQASIDSANANA